MSAVQILDQHAALLQPVKHFRGIRHAVTAGNFASLG